MKSAIILGLLLVCVNSSPAQPSCDFFGRDSLLVVVARDTVNIWNVELCGYCSVRFDISVSRSADSIYIVQTDTAGSIATCGCLFNLRAAIVGLPPGTYWAVVKRQSLKKYGYGYDRIQFVGSVQFQYTPTASPTLSSKTFQSECIPTSVAEEAENRPSQFALLQNFPNPFNPTTTIRFRIADFGLRNGGQSEIENRKSNISLKVFDVLGREVAVLVDGELSAGEHAVVFSTTGLPSGVYFYRLNTGSFIEYKKMVLMR